LLASRAHQEGDMERDPNVEQQDDELRMTKTPVGAGDPMDDATDKLADAASLERHAEPADAGDIVGEGVGGAAGGITGAAVGALFGPVGAVIGGIAGAAGGWWAGRTVSEAIESFSDREDEYFRSHYESADARHADRSYDDVRPAYQLGYVARHNPSYRDRSFDDIEPELARGWTGAVRERAGEWEHARPFARAAYEREHLDESTPERIGETTGEFRERLRDQSAQGGM
jgi:hypothetical protein